MEDNKKQTLSSTLKQIEKQFGKGSVMRLGDMGAVMNVETVSTGSLSLDLALGIGGLPRGRVVEIYGPEASGKTTLTLHVAAEIQRLGGVAAFIDAEHALDSKYAERLGVNIGELLLSQPSSGEEALEIADIFVRSGSVDLVIIDSVAALTPKAELDGDMGDSHMGLQARLMSQALRKLTANIKRSNTLVVFINQIRIKIGVTWGCFHHDTPVMLSDGTKEKIGTLVAQKIPAKVLSYNPLTEKFEARRIVNWYDNGKTDAFWQFKVGDQTASHHFVCTPNHRLLTPNGYQAAGNLNVGDKLMTCKSFYISPKLEQVTWGTLLGNNDLRSLPHKIEALAGKVPMKVTAPVKATATALKRVPVSAGCQAFTEDDLIEEALKLQTPYPSPILIERLEPLAIALWYIDQGTLQQNRCFLRCPHLPEDKQEVLLKWFEVRGLSPTLTGDHRMDFNRMNFNERDTVRLHEMIASYLPPSMDYKLLPTLRGRFVPLEVKKQRVLRAVPMPILEIRPRPMTVPAHRFDLEIEGHHNYLVDNVIVHNSPETTTGGNALKFYASVRLDIRRIGPVKRGEEIIGNETRVKIVKNKLAPPLREVTFDMIYGDGISRVGEIIDLGVKYEIIDKAGTWYSYNGERLGQGKETVRNFLKEHPDVATHIEKQIRDKAIVKPIVPEFVDNSSNGGDEVE